MIFQISDLVIARRKKLRTRVIYFMTLLLIFLSFNNQTWAVQWGFRGLLPRGTGYYDISSIKKINDHISRVWTVTLYNEQGKADAFLMLKRKDKAPENPDVLNQESTLLEFDCANGKYRIVSMNIYDEKDHELLSIPEINGTWHDIVPNSINEKLKNIVCHSGDTSKKEKITSER